VGESGCDHVKDKKIKGGEGEGEAIGTRGGANGKREGEEAHFQVHAFLYFLNSKP